ncbi:GntR family transcriptional regulator [Nocardioides bruguierae]|uniref:GntR family transcriptional regulator n=1 Tax=Nocardioides bruguierae TaxID=2945102 RepID=UPI00202194E2|nr:GntR family transcriptional regulator [Nocardioides bruguierae]MCL8025751.1 GntR family transcriptional regulator [Nocardioides bruguierae]
MLDQQVRKTVTTTRRVGSSRDRAIRLAHDALRSSIRRGRLGPDQPLVEFKLVRTLGIGRNAVREVLRRLADEGLVIRRPAIGTIIPRPMIRVSPDEIVGFDGDCEEQFEQRVTVEVLAQELIDIAEDLSSSMAIPARMQLVESLIHVDGEPLALLSQLIPEGYDMARMTNRWEPLDRPFLRLYGVRLGSTSTTVEAVAADAWCATLLGTDEGAPLILREQVLESEDGSVRMMNFARYRADRVAFTASSTSGYEGR